MPEYATHFATRTMVPDFNSPEAICACGTRAAVRTGTGQWFCNAHKPVHRENRASFPQRLAHTPMLGEAHGDCPCGAKSEYRYQLGRDEYRFCARHRPADHANFEQLTQITRSLLSERVARLTACPCGEPGTEKRLDTRRMPFWFCRAHVPLAFADVRMHSSALVLERLRKLTRAR